MVRKTLGDALGFNADGRYYYAFRDYSTDLEYLRHGRELAEKGLYVELQGYEYHTFLDFREIRDDDYGTWGKLCLKLQGQPVESLDEEVKQIRYAAIIAPFAELSAKLPERMDPLFDPRASAEEREKNRDFLRNGIAALFLAIGEQTGHRKNIEGITDRIVREFEFAATLTGMRSQGKSENRAVQFVQSALQGKECEFNRLFLALYLILHRIGELEGKSDFAVRSADWLDQFGLARVLRTAFHQFQGTEGLAPLWGSGTEVQMMQILLTHQAFLADRDAKAGSKRMNALFDDEKAREFLLVHRNNGVEWFNKERFEDLMLWLYLTDMVSWCAETVDESRISEMLALGYESIIDYVSKAESAHYRTDIFRSSL
jgi:hypothetical protein